jgi:CheY-like chemotaxis protein
MSSPTLKSILLIDDDEISNLFNKIFISKLDLEVDVDVVFNGAEAIKFLKDLIADPKNLILKPCLLLLDIRMPIMDGWEFLEAYDDLVDQETKNQIIVVMLTTSEDEGDTIRAMNNPIIKEIIKKPLSENKFNMLIKKFFVAEKTL